MPTLAGMRRRGYTPSVVKRINIKKIHQRRNKPYPEILTNAIFFVEKFDANSWYSPINLSCFLLNLAHLAN